MGHAPSASQLVCEGGPDVPSCHSEESNNEAQHSGPGRSPRPALQSQEPWAGSPTPAVTQSPFHPPRNDALLDRHGCQGSYLSPSGREPRKLQQCFFPECLENRSASADGRWHAGSRAHQGRRGPYSSLVQFAGLSILCPSLSSLKSSSTGIPGYGEPPRVKISHINTPKDQLQRRETTALPTRLHRGDRHRPR